MLRSRFVDRARKLGARSLVATTSAAVAATLMAAAGCGGADWRAAPCPNCPNVKYPGSLPSAEAGGLTSDEGHPAPTLAEAEAFMAEVDSELKRLWVERERAAWVQMNFITHDTNIIAARTEQATMEFLSKTIADATRFDGLEMPAELKRKFHLLKLAGTLPAPRDKAKTEELSKLMSSMSSRYGKGKYCPKPAGALRKELARDRKNRDALACTADKGGVSLVTLSKLMGESRNEEALREAWVGWREVSVPMRPDYGRFVKLGNEGARAIGFKDMGDLWRSGYDMPSDQFRGEVERLWSQMKPFYEELHCYVRSRLQDKYGQELVKDGAPIPAHLLGNMWSQQWGNIYPLLEPHRGQRSIDVTRALKAKRYDELKMVKTAEGFFTSLGLDKLPDTFYERSLFVKPKDRDVECHASAWDVNFEGDLRIKMCIQTTEEELQVVHHELGHNYYYMYYSHLPVLFQSGANDGFHEAIGDSIALSMTPGYLKQIGLLARVPNNDKAEINYLFKMALEKVAFLPFGKVIDQWRWNAFDGSIAPADFNRGWWDLRTKYQGIAPPVARTEEHFDPGAKYHVSANVPYTRYFLAFIYQFQFQRALCKAAGHEGPLHQCSIYGSRAAGDKLKALLRMGASKPWQQALEAMTGERAGDAGALLEYFEPLRGWLKEQVKGKKCGW